MEIIVKTIWGWYQHMTSPTGTSEAINLAICYLRHITIQPYRLRDNSAGITHDISDVTIEAINLAICYLQHITIHPYRLRDDSAGITHDISDMTSEAINLAICHLRHITIHSGRKQKNPRIRGFFFPSHAQSMLIISIKEG